MGSLIWLDLKVQIMLSSSEESTVIVRGMNWTGNRDMQNICIGYT